MRIIDDLLSHVDPSPSRHSCAVVPFWGSGVDGRAFAQAGLDVIGADWCRALVTAHHAVAKAPEPLVEDLRSLALAAARAPEEHYYGVRDGGIPLPTARRFFYLVGSSFNGLWRENSDGGHNVPFGRPFSFDAEAIRTASVQMARVTLSVAGWRDTLSDVPKGALVYADPPYLGDFTGYGGDTFGVEETRDLVETLASLAGRGRDVWMSNAPRAEAIVRKVCPSATIHRITARRSIAGDGGARGDVSEILVHF